MTQHKIAIAGKQGAGKSHLAAAFSNIGWLTFSIADPIKQLVALAHPNASKTDHAMVGMKMKTVRELYQAIGGAIRTHVDSYFWLTIATNRIDEATRTYRSIVVDDVRTPTEAQWLKDSGFTIIKLVVPTETRAARIGKLIGEDDETETGVDDIVADIKLDTFLANDLLQLLNDAQWATHTDRFSNAMARVEQFLNEHKEDAWQS
jgi:dephospho-CoA kinase